MESIFYNPKITYKDAFFHHEFFNDNFFKDIIFRNFLRNSFPPKQNFFKNFCNIYSMLHIGSQTLNHYPNLGGG